MEFHRKLARLMNKEAPRLTYRKVAELVGDVTHSTVGEWVRGKSVPRLDQAIRLAEIFNVPIAYLACDEQEQPYADPVSAEERRVLDLARLIGYETALRRMAVAPSAAPPEPVIPGPSWEETQREPHRRAKG